MFQLNRHLLGKRWVAALAVSIPIALVILVFAIHVRPDLVAMLGSPRIIFKFLFALPVVAAGLWATERLSRPGESSGPALWVLAAAAIVLLSGIIAELVAIPPVQWLPAMVGDRALACLTLIPTLALAPFAALFWYLRVGAPDNTKLTGAAIGLACGGIGATLYATHCTNDSPLFVAAWYSLAITLTTVLGAYVGERVLRW